MDSYLKTTTVAPQTSLYALSKPAQNSLQARFCLPMGLPFLELRSVLFRCASAADSKTVVRESFNTNKARFEYVARQADSVGSNISQKPTGCQLFWDTARTRTHVVFVLWLGTRMLGTSSD